MAADLQKLMRHRDIQTTMKHYVGRDTDELSARLAAMHEAENADAASITDRITK